MYLISLYALPAVLQEGGPGFAYWADYLDLTAQEVGAVLSWDTIEQGIKDGSKTVCLIDHAWLTSFNCLKELAYSIHHDKPVAVLVLDMEAWDLLTKSGGVEKCWQDLQWGPALSSFEGKCMIPGDRPFSKDYLAELFTYLGSINFCACRAGDEAAAPGGMEGLLQVACTYVQKDQEHCEQHAELKTLAMAWQQGGKPGSLLLQKARAEHWDNWCQVSLKAMSVPAPTQLQQDFVAHSLHASKQFRKRAAFLLGVLMVLIVCGGVGSLVMGLQAMAAQAEAERQAARAEVSAEEAIRQRDIAIAAEAEAERQRDFAVSAAGSLLQALGERGCASLPFSRPSNCIWSLL